MSNNQQSHQRGNRMMNCNILHPYEDDECRLRRNIPVVIDSLSESVIQTRPGAPIVFPQPPKQPTRQPTQQQQQPWIAPPSTPPITTIQPPPSVSLYNAPPQLQEYKQQQPENMPRMQQVRSSLRVEPPHQHDAMMPPIYREPPPFGNRAPQFANIYPFEGRPHTSRQTLPAIPPGSAIHHPSHVAVPMPMEPRGLVVEPENVWLEEIVEGPLILEEKTRRCTISDSVNQACVAMMGLRGQCLDWIWDKGNLPFEPCPPCPPFCLLCECAGPTRIRPIDDCFCACGRPGYRCDDCCGMLPVCPYCGRRLPCRSPCGFDCISSCFSKPPPPVPLPELVVTSVGPFRDKRYEAVCSPCSPCVDDLAFACGRLIGSKICKNGEPPPRPIPGRPIQRLFPSFFPPLPPKKKRLGNCFPFCLCQKPEPPYKPPKGGLAGMMEDVCAVGIGSGTLAAECFVETVNQCTCNNFDPLPGSIHCSCSPPLLRYPKNGVYEDLPVHPTKLTGCRFIDALNNFMDSLTIQPSKLEKVELIKEPEIPETGTTGNTVVDKINNLLDKCFPPRKEFTSTGPWNHNPYQALITYLTSMPLPIPDESFLPCLEVDEDGLNMFERHLPTVCLGEGVDCGVSRCGPQHIDYVNFSLIPSDLVEVTGPSVQGHPVIVPTATELVL